MMQEYLQTNKDCLLLIFFFRLENELFVISIREGEREMERQREKEEGRGRDIESCLYVWFVLITNMSTLETFTTRA